MPREGGPPETALPCQLPPGGTLCWRRRKGRSISIPPSCTIHQTSMWPSEKRSVLAGNMATFLATSKAMWPAVVSRTNSGWNKQRGVLAKMPRKGGNPRGMPDPGKPPPPKGRNAAGGTKEGAGAPCRGQVPQRLKAAGRLEMLPGGLGGRVREPLGRPSLARQGPLRCQTRGPFPD